MGPDSQKIHSVNRGMEKVAAITPQVHHSSGTVREHHPDDPKKVTITQ